MGKTTHPVVDIPCRAVASLSWIYPAALLLWVIYMTATGGWVHVFPFSSFVGSGFVGSSFVGS